MTDWKQTLETLERFRPTYRNEYSEVYCHAYDEAIRLCTAASRLPSGVDPVKVLEEYVAECGCGPSAIGDVGADGWRCTKCGGRA
jgi:hypothetical protein